MKSFLILIFGMAALAAEDQVQFQPGVLAKIYACGSFTGTITFNAMTDTSGNWPIKNLPDSPGEIQRLREFPIVEATSLKRLNSGSLPSYLVTPKTSILRDINYYAIEFEGYFLAPLDGVYTLVVNSDDPIDLFIEAKSVLKSEYSVSPIIGPTLDGAELRSPHTENLAYDSWVNEKDFENSRIVASAATLQASVRLSPNKYYHTVVVCRQRWFPAMGLSDGYKNCRTSSLNRGAVLKIVVVNPDGKSGALSLQLPASTKAAP